jgi:hypothetical protein
MSRLFTYRFEDGFECEVAQMTAANLNWHEVAHGECIYNGWAEFMGVGQPSRLGVVGGTNTRGDGFRSGYHPGLNMHISGPEHYSRVLKEKGMVEVGNEKQKDKKRFMQSMIGVDEIKEIREMGGDIGDIAAEKLMSPTEIKPE